MVSASGNIWFLYLNLCVLVAVYGSESSHKHHVKECGAVQHAFSHQKIGSRTLVPDNKIHDSEIKVCFNGKEHKKHRSCCTRETEVKYLEAAERYLKDSLRSSNAYLKKLVMESLAQFQERILDLLEEAQNRTSLLLTQVHNIPLRKHRGTVGDFFLDMEQYARRQHVTLQDSVQTFFTELFPIVFDNILSDPSVIQYDDQYKSCLLQSEEEIHPFGNVPKHLTRKLVQAFQRARSFVTALSVITEAINSTDHIEFDQNCREAATRLQYCRHCQNHVEVKPCHGFCLNVIGGCLATVSEISPSWDELISVVGSLTESMKDRHSLEKVLNSIDTEISNGILLAMDDGPRIYSEVMSRCQGLKSKTTPTGTDRNTETLIKPRPHRRPTPSFSLMDQLDSVLKKLMDSRGIYNRLASEICSQSLLYEQDMQSSKCWSGHKVEQYTKLVPESSFIAQAKANPEVKVDVRPNYKLVVVREKLAHMKKNLSTLLTDEQMQRDAPEDLYSSGEGRLGNKDVIINDDEDLYDPNGSGSGHSGDGPALPEDRPTPTRRPTSPEGVGAGSSAVSSIILLVLCFTLHQFVRV